MVDGVFIELFPNVGWRYMLGLAFVPGLLMFYGFWKLPESPRWLALKGKRNDALHVLIGLRESDQEAVDELAEILQSMASNRDDHTDENCDDNSDIGPSEYGTLPQSTHLTNDSAGVISRSFDMLSDIPTRNALFLGCGLMVIQQCCGINT
jgi:MFS family permease